MQLLSQIAVKLQFRHCKASDLLLFWDTRLIQILTQKLENIFTWDNMGNKRNRRSRRLETPSPDREIEATQIETPKTGNEALVDLSNVVQENLGGNSSENQLTEPSQMSNEMQVWTQIMEQKNNYRIEKMREEMENKLEAILREIKSNKSVSTVTNPRSDINELQKHQPSGSKLSKSIGVRASNNENSDSENDDYPLRASKVKDLKHPARPFVETETDLDQIILSNEESEEEDYHMVTGANRQLHRQSSKS